MEEKMPRKKKLKNKWKKDAHEMMAIEPGEKPSRKFTWKPTAWISHIMCRSHDDRFPMTVWETWFWIFWSTLGVPIPDLVENPRSCDCQHFDIYGDHLHPCQLQSTALHTDEWFVYRLTSVGHRVKTHKITLISDKNTCISACSDKNDLFTFSIYLVCSVSMRTARASCSAMRFLYPALVADPTGLYYDPRPVWTL